MQTINIHEAKTHLSRLIEQAVKGEPFIIALNTPEPLKLKRLGFMAGQILIPDDFDQMGSGHIEQIFGDDI